MSMGHFTPPVGSSAIYIHEASSGKLKTLHCGLFGPMEAITQMGSVTLLPGVDGSFSPKISEGHLAGEV